MFIAFLFFLIVDVTSPLCAQTTTESIEFIPVFGNEDVHANDFYFQWNNTDSIRIETLKFYISEIVFLQDDKIVWKEKNSFHLIDASSPKTLILALVVPSSTSYNKLKFNIGIDSVTNVSGVFGGDLDPTKGMYWTWQSGYINFKLEGKSNVCETRNNEFQFHIGGYQFPFNTLQTVILERKSKVNNSIYIDVKKLISSTNLSNQHSIMSPGDNAVLLSKKLPELFNMKQ